MASVSKEKVKTCVMNAMHGQDGPAKAMLHLAILITSNGGRFERKEDMESIVGR